jgi:hypothetical protein
MSRRYRCQRCGYHYPPQKLVVGPGLRFPVCADRAACDRHLRLRELDRKALGR